MKTLLLVLLAFFVPIKSVHAPIESNDITVLQINARWNQNKTIDTERIDWLQSSIRVA